MKNRSIILATEAIDDLYKQVTSYSPTSFEHMMKFSRDMLFEANKNYEDLMAQQAIAREMIEVLRINLHAFSLTLNKISESSIDDAQDLQTMCISFLKTFRTLISIAGHSVPNDTKPA